MTEEQGSTVAMRSADPSLVDQVRQLCALVGLPLVVLPPGSDAPPATVYVDDVTEPVGLPWRDVLDEPVVDVAANGHVGGQALHLPADGERLLDALARASAPVRARVLGIVGASGGIGSSTLAAVLARLLARAGQATALVDLDPAGGGLDVLLGIEHDPGARWADVRAQEGGFPPARLTASLPVWQSVRVLSGDVRGGVGAEEPVARAAVTALARAADAVVIDLPRALLAPVDGGWPALCDDVLLVAGCDVRAAAAASAAAGRLAGTPAGLVVRRPAAGSLLPEDVAEACELPLVAAMRPERAFAAGLERGMTPGDQQRGPLLAAARLALRRLDWSS